VLRNRGLLLPRSGFVLRPVQAGVGGRHEESEESGELLFDGQLLLSGCRVLLCEHRGRGPGSRVRLASEEVVLLEVT
jgi:hypothetical protein